MAARLDDRLGVCPVEDGEALRRMLDYIAAECRRLGAAEAARMAAGAAHLLAARAFADGPALN
jgi:hypothetical protein